MELDPIRVSGDALSEMGKQPSKAGIVVSLPTIESTFVWVTGRGPQGMLHPDYAALYVAVQLLNADEGFFWVRTSTTKACPHNVLTNSPRTELYPRRRSGIRCFVWLHAREWTDLLLLVSRESHKPVEVTCFLTLHSA